MNKYWKKILWNEFGIKVKTVSLGLFEDKRYALYNWANCSSGSIKIFYDNKLYSEEDIEKLVYKLRKEKGEQNE